MIIQSPFKDFYDPLAHQYRDPKVVYNRQPQLLFMRLRQYPFQLSGFYKDPFLVAPSIPVGKREQKASNRDGVGLLLVCGHVYPFGHSHEEFSERALETMSQLAHTVSFDVDFKNPYRFVDTRNQFHTLFRPLQRLDPGSPHPLARRVAQEVAPLALLLPRAVLLNPPLKPFHPPLDPYQTYQQILSTLQSTTPLIPRLTDTNKRDAAGFDASSFRRNAGGPTRKRKKS